MIRTVLSGVLATFLLLSALMFAGCSGHGHEDGHSHDDGHGHDEPRAAAPAKPAEPAGDDDHDDDHAGHDHDHGGHDHDDHDGPGRHTRIAAETAARVGLRSEAVGAGDIRDEHRMQGLLLPIDGKVARVAARFPGPVRAVHVEVGDRVRAGQRLASVESNLSLSRYEITAPIAGTVLSRQVAVGDLAGEQVLFELADLDELWIDLHLFGADADHVDIGMPVLIERLSDGARAQTTLERVLPGAATASQSTVARARLANSDGRWRPGSAVRATVTVAARAVDIVVPLSALQRMDGQDVVFVRNGEEYEARDVALGERDGERVEVLSGIAAGEQVVVAQSFVIKADIEKAGASHVH